MNFEEAFEEFKIYAAKRHKKQCFDTLRHNFKNHVLPYFKGCNVEDITIQDIINWQDTILKQNYSNNSNKNIYVSFNSFLDYCVLNDYISTNKLRLVGSFKKNYEVISYNIYSYFDYIRFRHGLNNRIYRYFFDLLFFYGLRSGEAMALKFSALKNNKLHIGSSISRRGNREIDLPKTIKSNRYLIIKPIMLLELFILKCYYIKKYGVDSDYFVFGGKSPLSPTSVNRYKHKACLLTGVKEIKVHEFRHSCATRMIKKGIPVETVSNFLGHSSISITLDIYVHNEKREKFSLVSDNHFLNTLRHNFKKLLSYIITQFV